MRAVQVRKPPLNNRLAHVDPPPIYRVRERGGEELRLPVSVGTRRAARHCIVLSAASQRPPLPPLRR